MPLRVPAGSYIYLEMENPYEISYQNKHEIVSVSAPNKDDAKDMFTFALIEVGLKESP